MNSSAATHGNATGIGMAEFCKSRCVEKMNAKITRINCLTGGHPTGAMLPLDYPTDRECLDAASHRREPRLKIRYVANRRHRHGAVSGRHGESRGRVAYHSP